jgi:antibiotic biosynthesis monooxygenase (ABM) superfamily enzyme
MIMTLPESAATPPHPTPPGIHVRALLTWLAIFPLVALGMTVLTPLTDGWHPVLRALVLTLVVVPIAVYLVMPRYLRAHAWLSTRRRR